MKSLRWRLVATLVVCATTFTSLSLCLADGIQDRKREPVVVRVEDKFDRWVSDSAPAGKIELWRYLGSGNWEIIPYQVDEFVAPSLGDPPDDIKPLMSPGAAGRHCLAEHEAPGELPSEVDGPCEFLYELRGSAPASGTLTSRDEIVFLAGYSGACDAPNSDWVAGTSSYRHRIELLDSTPSGTEKGCVYAYRRVTGSPPTVPDLIDYDPVGDGLPGTCLPHADACGAINAHAVDFDGDQTMDVPAYRMDFQGNWSIDQWRVGQSTGTLQTNMVDMVKSRIENPPETEQGWDLLNPEVAACATFRGFIDGPVRVIRDIQGAQSGQGTRKLEIAYPGEVSRRVFLRVHAVGGPIYTYTDFMEANVQPATVYKKDYTGAYDILDGSNPTHGQSFNSQDWYQVSSGIGSLLTYPVLFKSDSIDAHDGAYDDDQRGIWPFPDALKHPEWDSETGDYAAGREEIYGVSSASQNPDCEDPFVDSRTPIFEFNTVVLSHTTASQQAGIDEVARRDRGVLGQCVAEEQFESGGGSGNPCPKPQFSLYHGHDGGPVRIDIDDNGCSDLVGWNLYQSIGSGTYRRLATLGPGQSFVDIALALNEERSYRGASLSSGCQESEWSDAISVLNDDTVAPPAPEEIAAAVTGQVIEVTWNAALAGDVGGYRVQVAQQSGGPYTQTHTGILGSIVYAHSFPALPGTHYIVLSSLDKAGNESPLSSEVVVVMEGP